MWFGVFGGVWIGMGFVCGVMVSNCRFERGGRREEGGIYVFVVWLGRGGVGERDGWRQGDGGRVE